MIKLFESTENEFTSNGLGTLDNKIIEPKVTEDLNGIYAFSFKYPIHQKHANEIEHESIIETPVPDEDDQLFRVYRIIKSNGFLEVFCYHITYDLIDNLIEDTFVVEKTGQGAINQILNATQFPHRFIGVSNIGTVANARIVRYNPIEALLDDGKANTFVSRWGGEIKRNNFKISINDSIGSNRGKKIQHGKDLLGYEADVDFSTATTRIMPKGFDGLLLPEKYIDSPLINTFAHPKIDIYDYEKAKAAVGQYEDDDDAMPIEDAYTLMRDSARSEFIKNKVDIPHAEYKVEFLNLGETEEYKQFDELQKVLIGDTVEVEHKAENFSIIAKVVHYEFDPLTKKYTNMTLGNFADQLSKDYVDVKEVAQKVEQLVRESQTVLITADGKNTITNSQTQPSNPVLGDLWFKRNGSDQEMYQWVNENGVKFWKLLLSEGRLNALEAEVSAIVLKADEDRAAAEQAIEDAILTGNQFAENEAAKLVIKIDNDLSAQKTAIENKYDTAIANARSYTNQEVKKVDDKVIATEQDIAAEKIRINDAVSKADQAIEKAGFNESDITGIEELVSGIQVTVTDKADKSQITVLQNQIVNKVESSDYSTKMTQLDDAINLRLTKEQTLEEIMNDKAIITNRKTTNELPFWYFNNYRNSQVKETKELGAIGVDTTTFECLLVTNVGNKSNEVFQEVFSVYGSYRRAASGGYGWTAWKKSASVETIVSEINLGEKGIRIQGKNITLDGDVYMDNAFIGDLKTKSLEAIYADIATLKTKILTANVIEAGMLKTDNASINKLFATTAAIQTLTSKTAFINEIKTKSLEAVYADIEVLKTKVLTANVIDSNMLKSETATINKLFATTALIQTLTSKTAFIDQIKTVELSADKIVTGVLNGTNVSVINLNANNIIAGNLNAAKVAITNLKADVITSGTLNGNQVNIENLKVENIFGLNSQFIETAWNENNYGVRINAAGINIGDIEDMDKDLKSVFTRTGIKFYSRNELVSEIRHGPNGIYGGGENGLQIELEAGRFFEIHRNNEVFFEVLKASDTMQFRKEVRFHAPIVGNTQLSDGIIDGNLATFEQVKMSELETVRIRPKTGYSNSNLLFMDQYGVEVARINTKNNSGSPGVKGYFSEFDVTAKEFIRRSDRRYKENIEQTTIEALPIIESFNFVEFDWIKREKEEPKTLGLIAQDTPDLATKDDEGFYAIKNSKQIMLNSLGIKELLSKVRRLENKLAKTGGK